MPTRAEILREVFKTKSLSEEKQREGQKTEPQSSSVRIPYTSAASASGSSSNAMHDRMEEAKPKPAPSRSPGATPMMPENARGKAAPAWEAQARAGQARGTRQSQMPVTHSQTLSRETVPTEEMPAMTAKSMPEQGIARPGNPIAEPYAQKQPGTPNRMAQTRQMRQPVQRPGMAHQQQRAETIRPRASHPLDRRSLASPERMGAKRPAAGSRLAACLNAIPKTHPGYQTAQMLKNEVLKGKEIGTCKCPAMFYESYRAALVQAGIPFLAKTGEPCMIMTSRAAIGRAVQCLSNTYKQAAMTRPVMTAKEMENDVSGKTAGLRKNVVYLYGLTAAERSAMLSDMDKGQNFGIQNDASGKCQIGVNEKAVLTSPDKTDMLRSALYAALRCSGPLRKTNRMEEQQKQEVIRMTAENHGMNMLTPQDPYLYLANRAEPNTYYRISKNEMQKFRFAGKDPKTGKNKILSEGSISRSDRNFAQAFDQTVLSMTHPAVTNSFADVKNMMFGKPGPLQAVGADIQMQQRGEKSLAHLIDAICRDRLSGQLIMQSDDTQRKADLFFAASSALLKLAAGEPNATHATDFTSEDVRQVRAMAKANGINLKRYMGAADRLSTFTVEVKRAESVKGNVEKALTAAKREQQGESRSTSRSRGEADIGEQD